MGRNHLPEQQVPKDPTIYLPEHASQQGHQVLASVSRGYPCLQGSLITCYSPVRHFTRLATFTCDLHASSTPPTFVLSQDQTLHLECCSTQGLADVPIARHPDRLGTACAVPTRSLTRSTSRPPRMPKIGPQGACLGGGRGRVATSLPPSRTPAENREAVAERYVTCSWQIACGAGHSRRVSGSESGYRGLQPCRLQVAAFDELPDQHLGLALAGGEQVQRFAERVGAGGTRARDEPHRPPEGILQRGRPVLDAEARPGEQHG